MSWVDPDFSCSSLAHVLKEINLQNALFEHEHEIAVMPSVLAVYIVLVSLAVAIYIYIYFFCRFAHLGQIPPGTCL